MFFNFFIFFQNLFDAVFCRSLVLVYINILIKFCQYIFKNFFIFFKTFLMSFFVVP